MPQIATFERNLRCALTVSLLFVLLLLPGCGAVSVGGWSNPGGNSMSSATGTVSIVQLTWASDHSGMISVTVVTLLRNGGAQDLTFCGSQTSQFPLNAYVTANYTPGTACSTLISVKIAG